MTISQRFAREAVVSDTFGFLFQSNYTLMHIASLIDKPFSVLLLILQQVAKRFQFVNLLFPMLELSIGLMSVQLIFPLVDL